MDPDTVPIATPLLAAATTAALGAVFACADTALISLTPARLEALTVQASTPGRRRALDRVTHARARIHARYLLGRLVCSGAAVAFFCWWAYHSGAPLWLRLGASGAAALLLSLLYECGTALGRTAADWVVPTAARYFRPVELLLAPLAAVTTLCSHWFVGRRLETRDPRVAEAEVEFMVDQGEKSGVLDQEPAEMIRNVLEFSELTARDAMVPRTRIVAIEADTPLDEVMNIVTESGHSRYPVYEEQIDDVIGLLFAKDVFRVLQRERTMPPPDSNPGAELSPADARPSDPVVTVTRPAAGRAGTAHVPTTLRAILRAPTNFVSESQPLSTLMREMRQKRQHMAVVVNEFGGVSGIVTLEDVLEEIVGNIEDEEDTEDETPIVDLGEGRLLADAALLLSDLGRYLGTELDPDGDYDSRGGMLAQRLGRVPEVGASMDAFGLHFVVRASDERHVEKVEIERRAPVSDATAASASSDIEERAGRDAT